MCMFSLNGIRTHTIDTLQHQMLEAFNLPVILAILPLSKHLVF